MHSVSKDLKLKKQRYFSEKPFANLSKKKIEKLPHLAKRSYDSTAISTDKEKYLGLLKGIDKLCDSFAQMPVIEFEDDNKDHTSHQLKDPELIPSDNIKLNYIISQLKQRLKDYPEIKAVYPFSSRFKVFSGTEEKVGPGSYRSSIESKQESHEFSNIPRLFTPVTHMMHTIESLYKKKGGFVEETIIKKNKNLATNPSKLKEDFAVKIAQNKDKEKNVKLKKELIENHRKAEKTCKLIEKNKKYEMRVLKKEALEVKKTWILLFACVGIRTVIAAKTKMRKILRQRYGRFLKRFCLRVRAIGKFAIILKKCRKKILLKKMFLLRQPLSFYLEKLIEREKNIVKYFFEKTQSFSLIVHLMARWKIVGVDKEALKNFEKAHVRRSTLGVSWSNSIEMPQKPKLKKKLTQKLT